MEGLFFLCVLIFFLYLIIKRKSNNDNEHIKILVRQTARWGVASQQDKSPIIALLHANYAAGYLWALMDIATGEEIRDATGIDIGELKKRIIYIQDKATKHVSNACSNFSSDLDLYLLKIGGDI